METSVVATDTARVVVGVSGACVLSIFIAISMLGPLFNGVLSSGRYGYASARDGQFPRFMARLSRSQKTPYVAILVHASTTILFLSVPGSNINTLLVFTKPVEFAFSLVIVAALVRLRLKLGKKAKDESTSSFKMPLYPLPLLVVIVSSLYMIINSLISVPVAGSLGIVFTSVAFPIHYFFVRPHLRPIKPDAKEVIAPSVSNEAGVEAGIEARNDTTGEILRAAAALAPASALKES